MILNEDIIRIIMELNNLKDDYIAITFFKYKFNLSYYKIKKYINILIKMRILTKKDNYIYHINKDVLKHKWVNITSLLT